MSTKSFEPVIGGVIFARVVAVGSAYNGGAVVTGQAMIYVDGLEGGFFHVLGDVEKVHQSVFGSSS